MRTHNPHHHRVIIVFALLCLPTTLRSQEPPLFGEPRVLLEHTTRIIRPVLTSDERTLYFGDLPNGDPWAAAIWEATRPEPFGPFEPARKLGSVINRGSFPFFPYLAADDSLFYFSVGLLPGGQLFVAPRSSDGHFDEAFPLDVGRGALMGCVSPDSSELFFVSGEQQFGDRDLWVAHFDEPGEPLDGFFDIQRVEGVNMSADEWPPGISPDGLVLLWSHRPWNESPPVPPGHGGADIWMAVRASLEAPFGVPVNLPSPPNGPGAQAFPFVPADGQTLLFGTLSKRVWEADACFASEIAATFTISDEPTAGEETSFDATKSTVLGGGSASYEWWFGDGDQAEGVQVSHRFEAAGRYPVTLVVTSDQGACNHRREMVTVTCGSAGVPDWTSADIGEPIFPGNASYAGEDGGCLTICAGGTGISGSSDQCHFVFQETSGDVILTTRVSNLSSAGHVGVMFRESLEADSRRAVVLVESSGAKRKFRLRYREEAGARSRVQSGDAAEPPDAWIQVRRVDKELIGLSSHDGEEWTEIGRVTIDFPGPVLAGIVAHGNDRFPDQPYVAATASVCDLRLDAVPTIARYRRADCNGDGTVNISDATSTLATLFLGEDSGGCDDACDANDDGRVDISDAIASLGVLFLGEGNIPLPGMTDCGVDPTEDELGCGRYNQCRPQM